MDMALWKFIADFGFPALVCFALGWFIVWSHKQHAAERKTDREERRIVSDKSSASTDKLSEAVHQLQITLAENKNVESNR